jgi:nucleoside-diphosphate-sugar epimerase
VVTQYHIIGASGRSGRALCASLLADRVAYVPVVRSAARWAESGLPGEAVVADLRDGPALARALAGATHVACCAHARHAGAVLAAAPAAAVPVFLGSTRKFTRWPDAHGSGVLDGEAAFLAAGRPGAMLHPTMIYGAQGEDNVQRLARLLKRLPVVPLPAGGRAMVQPIHQDDLTRCLRAALRRPWTAPTALVVAGPEAMAYADFVRAVAAAAGLRPPAIVPVPAPTLRLAARVAGLLPFLPRVGPDEIRRLTEDKAFDIGPMRRALGVRPRSLADGLARLAPSLRAAA